MCPIECLPNRLGRVLHTRNTGTCTKWRLHARALSTPSRAFLPASVPRCYHMSVGVGCLRAGCISGMRQRARQPCQEERTTVNGLAENRVRHACAGASAGLPQAAVVQRAKGDDAAEGEWSPVIGVMMRRGFLSGRHKQGHGGRATEAGLNLPITNNIPVETTFTRFH